jgi:hypothetical protein
MNRQLVVKWSPTEVPVKWKQADRVKRLPQSQDDNRSTFYQRRGRRLEERGELCVDGCNGKFWAGRRRLHSFGVLSSSSLAAVGEYSGVTSILGFMPVSVKQGTEDLRPAMICGPCLRKDGPNMS